jgi:hypothetical protein
MRYAYTAVASLLLGMLLTAPAEAKGGGKGGSGSKGSKAGGSKTVHVKGYTRKDGTYVAPHTRSAPGTRMGVMSGFDRGYLSPAPRSEPRTSARTEARTSSRGASTPWPLPAEAEDTPSPAASQGEAEQDPAKPRSTPTRHAEPEDAEQKAEREAAAKLALAKMMEQGAYEEKVKGGWSQGHSREDFSGARKAWPYHVGQAE